MINGPYLRELRKKHHYTLIQFSQEIGCTASFLSQRERGQKEPSLATLRKLSEVLGVPLAAFFLPDGAEHTAQAGYVLTKKDERPPLPTAVAGADGEALTPASHTMQGVFLTIPAGRRCCAESLCSHPGDECIYILQGNPTALVGDEVLPLHPGDCLYINGGTEHNLINDSSESCELLLFNN